MESPSSSFPSVLVDTGSGAQPLTGLIERVAWQQREVTCDFNELDDLMLSCAGSIHRSQGKGKSELRPLSPVYIG
jgi:hypothetical protein